MDSTTTDISSNWGLTGSWISLSGFEILPLALCSLSKLQAACVVLIVMI